MCQFALSYAPSLRKPGPQRSRHPATGNMRTGIMPVHTAALRTQLLLHHHAASQPPGSHHPCMAGRCCNLRVRVEFVTWPPENIKLYASIIAILDFGLLEQI